MKNKKFKKRLAVLGFALMGALGLIWYFVIGISANEPGAFYNKGHNAIWLEHKWVGEAHSREEIGQLVSRLEQAEIDTAFVHAGPLGADGTVDPLLYSFAPAFLEVAREFDPEIHYQAWLGQKREVINLDDPEVRHNVAKAAMIMSQLVDFDGVHFDIEPVWDEDLAFIETLAEARELMPEGKVISVALAEFIPQSVVWLTKETKDFQNYNTEVNYMNVSKYADQVVAMIYDTGIQKPWIYRKLVSEETIWLSRLLPEVELFVGIPSYESSEAETIENGVLGVVDGLNDIRSKEQKFAGVAIYAYWETDEAEWQQYEENWLK